MGRVGGRAANPLAAQGDILVGGAGTPTGYGSDACIGKSTTSDGTSGGWQDQTKVNDGSDATVWGSLHADAANGGPGWFRVDLGSPLTIGRARLLDGVGPFGSAGQRASEVIVRVSNDDVTYTQVIDWIRATQDTTLDFSSITARYWRFEATVILNPNDPPTHPRWAVYTCSLFPVTTVGAGNQTRLAPPNGRRVLAFNPSSSAPEWEALQPAIAAVAGAVPAGGVGTAAGGYDTAANRDTEIATVAEIKAQLNTVISELRAAGILT